MFSHKVRADWRDVLAKRTALLRTPLSAGPPLREALHGSGDDSIARVLLRARDAVAFA